MPVPDTGPEMPFPYASEAEAEAGLAPPVADAGGETGAREAPAEMEREKGFVGDFLTRVFGKAPQREEEDETPEDYFGAGAQAGRKEKAERLAKSSVAEFASNKLGAPVVADTLHADKVFMDQIADSLESALAEAERMEELSEPEDSFSTPAAANLASHEELPEPLPPEAEFIPYGDFEEDEPEFDRPVVEPAARSAQQNAEPAPAAREPAFDPIAASSGGHPDPMFAERGPVRADPEKAREVSPLRDIRGSDASPLSDHATPPEPPQQPEYDLNPVLSPETLTTVPGPVPQGLQLPSGIEDSIKEMLKPLIVQWLNDNLARIVEQDVREELADRRDGLPELRARGGH